MIKNDCIKLFLPLQSRSLLEIKQHAPINYTLFRVPPRGVPISRISHGIIAHYLRHPRCHTRTNNVEKGASNQAGALTVPVPERCTRNAQNTTPEDKKADSQLFRVWLCLLLYSILSYRNALGDYTKHAEETLKRHRRFVFACMCARGCLCMCVAASRFSPLRLVRLLLLSSYSKRSLDFWRRVYLHTSQGDFLIMRGYVAVLCTPCACLLACLLTCLPACLCLHEETTEGGQKTSLRKQELVRGLFACGRKEMRNADASNFEVL